MLLVHQATYIHNINPPPESAACSVGKLRCWSKPAEPTTLTLALALTVLICAHSHALSHIRLHFHAYNFNRSSSGQDAMSQLPSVSQFSRASLNHALMHLLTSSLDILQSRSWRVLDVLAWEFILIHIDVDDEYSKSFIFIFIVSGCYTTGGPVFGLQSASPANIPLW